MIVVIYLLQVLLCFGITYAVYLSFNKGLHTKSLHQQGFRYLIGSCLAFLPLALSGGQLLWRKDVLLSLGISLVWMITYPLLFHLTNRKTSPDYDNALDEAFGLYLFGLLSSLNILMGTRPVAGVVMAVVDFVLLLIPLVQIVWYALYRTCMDSNGMKIIQETDVNEAIGFFRSFSLWQNLLMVLPIVALGFLCYWCNAFPSGYEGAALALWQMVAEAALVLLFCFLMLQPGHGAFYRTGIMQMYHDVKEYVVNNRRYRAEQQKRVEDLQVKPLGAPADRPGTIIMVIGESACRDFMSAWHPEMEHDTTPWLRTMAGDERHTMLFKHAYSSAMQTVPALEKALTESNQYNGKPFYESCSIVDIAHKLGYKISWYSNQGHLGAADTPITLVADTADTAKWTKQEVGVLQYDESLVSFLDELNPADNNFVVFHLMGSHFSFLDRYPASFTRWGKPGVQDNVVNYENSIAYTDNILRQFYDYASQKLNLQAMVYFSDHATEPGRRRKPNFNGFQMTRIPMFAWLSESYISRHPERYQMLLANKDRYFTNDLVYELMCGIFDVSSNHFDETASLASDRYRFTRADLLTYEGKKHISEDEEEE